MANKLHLKILGADEDVPRLATAYGRGLGGELALVLRPREDEGALVFQPKKEAARVWVSSPALLPEGVEPSAGPRGGAPREPVTPVGAQEAVALLKRLKANPPKAGPATLRGAWRGWMDTSSSVPTVEMQRPIASYGVLKVWSTRAGEWGARFERAERWFTTRESSAPQQRATLAEAITAGMEQALGLVRDACSFRDTRRRNAVDSEYAHKHPYRPPPEPPEVIDRYQPKPRFRAVEGAAGWVVEDERGRVVESLGARAKGKAMKRAAALNRGEAPAAPSTPPPARVSPEIAGAFGLGGMPGVSVVPALDQVPAPEPPGCPTSVAKIASATGKEADALGELSQSLWGSTEAPELLRRAARLIKHAESLARSPLCAGKEQQAALAELRRAADAYEAARAALGRGDGREVTTELRRVAERVALAAARAAKGCAGGGAGGSSGGKKAGGSRAKAAPKAEAVPELPPVPLVPAQADQEAKDAALMNAFAAALGQAAAQMRAGGAM